MFAFLFLSGLFLSTSWSSLVFPSTLTPYYSFIAGFGIPVNNIEETVTVGYIIRTQFFTPYRANQLRPDYLRPINIRGRKNRGAVNATNDEVLFFEANYTDFSSYRWMIYSGIEGVIDKLGRPGHECVLRSICEYGNSNFHFETGLLGEILHLIFTPSSSADDIINHKNNEYFHAEYFGKTGGPCEKVFQQCGISFVDQISYVLELAQFD